MPFPRMTTRRWMIAVALAALFLATGVLLLRRAQLLREVAQLRDERDAPMSFTPDGLSPQHVREEALSHARRRRWSDDQIKRRERAARRPWLPVPPDPPEPE